MQYRQLGNTGLQVSIIGFGGIPIIERPDEEAIQVVRQAKELGVNLFDTARAYERKGLSVLASEDKIGLALAEERGELILCTKTQAALAEEATEHLQDSLRRLRTDYLDIWMLHSVDKLSKWETICGAGGALEAFVRARKQGTVRYLGISGHRPDVLRTVLEQFPFEVVMVPVNIVDRHVYNVETSLLPYCRQRGIGVLAMKPLAGGMLKEYAPLALRYCLGQDIASALPGMGTVKEVEVDVGAAADPRPLTPGEEEGLWQKVRALGLDFCRGCGYCLPCSVGIDIPTVFRLDGYFQRYGQEEWARQQYAEISPQADKCIECGDCESRCPYTLPIREKLRQTHARLTPRL